MKKEEFIQRQKKTSWLFGAFLIPLSIFVVTLINTVTHKRDIPKLTITKKEPAIRGKIISKDNFNLAYSQKIFKAVVDTRCINPNKEKLFVTLFSIYSGIDEKIIQKKLNSKKGSVVISYSINERSAKYLKELSIKLNRFKVFIPYKGNIYRGLDIIESGERRVYNYKDTLTPILGYTTKYEINNRTTLKGIKGLEYKYDSILNDMQEGIIKGERDIISYVNFNKKSTIKARIDGSDIVLNIPLKLQKTIEMILDKAKKEQNAQEIIASIMDSQTGKILALATSNRYDPLNISKKDYQNLQIHAIESIFEPGSVLKPITMALLFENKKVKMNDLVKSYGGVFKFGKYRITDTHFDKKMKYLTIPYTIIHSSNVGIAQFAQRLSGREFYYGLKSFGFTKKTDIDLKQERTGIMPSIAKFDAGSKQHKVNPYKVTVSYGYGISVTFMQLLKAYNVFNNDGIIVSPTIVEKIVKEDTQIIKLSTSNPKRVISKKNANIIKKLLIRTVNEGTGKKAIIKGLEIGGKTGTAHNSSGSLKYKKEYISSFFGFANDKKHKYTIGVTVFKPKRKYPYYYASETAVPVFKKIVQTLLEYGYLKKIKE